MYVLCGIIRYTTQCFYYGLLGDYPMSKDLNKKGTTDSGKELARPVEAAVTEIPREREYMGYLIVEDSVTAEQGMSSQTRQEIEQLITGNSGEVFQDGMASEFSRKLIAYIEHYGNKTIEILAEAVKSERVNVENAAEAMRWLGHISHPPTHDKRLWLLERSLRHPSYRISDGAIRGLESLDDPHAIPSLKKATQIEQYEELRSDMEYLVVDLQGKC